MNRQEIVRKVSKLNGTTIQETDRIVRDTFITIADALVRGEEVKISGFGKFMTILHNEKRLTDPQTKQLRTIPARMVPRFRPSAKLKEDVAEAGQQ